MVGFKRLERQWKVGSHTQKIIISGMDEGQVTVNDRLNDAAPISFSLL